MAPLAPRSPPIREKPTKAGAIQPLFDRFDATLRAAGYIAMGGQIAAPKQRNTEGEKRDLKEGRIPNGWKDKPAMLRQKDREARWTVKCSKTKERADGTKPPVHIAIPAFGYQNHSAIARRSNVLLRSEFTRLRKADQPFIQLSANGLMGKWLTLRELRPGLCH